MKKFKDKRTGVIEIPTNKDVIKQYEKHSDIYEEIKPNNAKKDDTENTENKK